jgi:hypothetical protein
MEIFHKKCNGNIKEANSNQFNSSHAKKITQYMRTVNWDNNKIKLKHEELEKQLFHIN